MRRITKALGMLHVISDKTFLRLAYRLELGKRLDLDSPVTLNEKLQWLKLNGALQRFSALADKWEAREYVRKVLGDEYLVPVLGVYDTPRGIPWRELPGQFVIKCTHGSHCNIICADKAHFDAREAEAKLFIWLKRNWYWFGREPVYQVITPRVMIERFMGRGGRLPVDYKVMCFNGCPRIIQVHEKSRKPHSISFYDADGKRLPISKHGFPALGGEKLDEVLLKPLLTAAERLARCVDTPYLRADFYLIEGQVYFSELTFFDSSGFKGFLPEGADAWLGDMLKLDYMTCPRCGHRMKARTISGSKFCDKVERFDECQFCGNKRHIWLEASS